MEIGGEKKLAGAESEKKKLASELDGLRKRLEELERAPAEPADTERVAELEAENAELREQAADALEKMDELSAEVEELRARLEDAESARLESEGALLRLEEQNRDAGMRAADAESRAEALEERISPRTKLLILNYPHNPTGTTLSLEDLLPIAELVEREGLLVISDEIYEKLTYDAEHICFSSLPGMRERTVLLGGFSKSYAMTGWRIGYAAAPAEIIEAMMRIHQYTMLCAPIIAQKAAIAALREGEEEAARMKEEFDRRRKLLVSGLNEIGLECFEPKGAFYAFPSIRKTPFTAMEFAERLLIEAKVVVVPGSAFGECGEGHVRVCYATSLTEIEEALERMYRFLRNIVGK